MTELPSLIVTGTANQILGNLIGGSTLSETALYNTAVTFVSNVPADHFVLWESRLEKVPPVVARFAPDGTLKRNGDPVKLLMNDVGLNVSGIQWTCQIAGMEDFTFDADADVDLSSVAAVPNLSVVGTPFSEAVLVALLTVPGSPLRVALDALYTSSGATDEYHPYANLAAFPTTGASDRIYLAEDTGKLYWWTGSAYQVIAGNAATALKLFTARLIDGQSFDGTADVPVIAPGTHAASSKPNPVDTDEIPLVDSSASNVLRKLTWLNLKGSFKSYYDVVITTLTHKDLTDGTNTFPTFNQNTTGTAGAIAGKSTPTGAFVGTTDTQVLTHKDLTDGTNTFPASVAPVSVIDNGDGTAAITASLLVIANNDGTVSI